MAEPAQSPEPLVPFGKYLLGECLAEGGMARVFRAKLVGLGGFEKQLVVKQIRPELAARPEFVAMFVEEAKTLVRMSHPNVVPVYELGVVDGTYFLAMEFVEGATLAEILAAGPLPPEGAAELALAVVEALAYAHDTFALVHRDVTPRNIMVDARGHVRLLDFGIATGAVGSEDAGTMGSLGYMSPEQAAGHTVDGRSDLFSLGAVLFEALSGEPAFLKGTREATAAALADARVPDAAALGGAPAPLVSLVRALLARDRERRPPKSALVAEQLRTWLAAHHPAGAKGVLEARARGARTRPRATPSTPPPGARTREHHDGGAKVQTLAASATLDAWLGTGARAEPSGAPSTGAAPKAPGTAPGTAPIAGRAKPRAAVPAPGPEARAPDAPGPRHAMRPWLVGAALAAAIGAAAIYLGPLAPHPSDAAGKEPARAAPSPTQLASPAPQTSPAPSTAPSSTTAGARGEAASAPAAMPAPAASASANANASADTDADADAGVGAAQPKLAWLSVNAVPWATLRLDGRPFGSTPRRLAALPAGKHTLELTCPPLGRSTTVPLELAAGAKTQLTVDLSASPPTVTSR